MYVCMYIYIYITNIITISFIAVLRRSGSQQMTVSLENDDQPLLRDLPVSRITGRPDSIRLLWINTEQYYLKIGPCLE